MRIWIGGLLAMVCVVAHAGPCDGLDRSKSLQGNTEIAKVIGDQLSLSKLEILGSISSGGWSVIQVQASDAQPQYLFYSGDVSAAAPKTQWSGAAAPDEGPKLKDWVIHNVPGIPVLLADCFAARVSEKNAL